VCIYSSLQITQLEERKVGIFLLGMCRKILGIGRKILEIGRNILEIGHLIGGRETQHTLKKPRQHKGKPNKNKIAKNAPKNTPHTTPKTEPKHELPIARRRHRSAWPSIGEAKQTRWGDGEGGLTAHSSHPNQGQLPRRKAT
jgi:hypothetical protein